MMCPWIRGLGFSWWAHESSSSMSEFNIAHSTHPLKPGCGAWLAVLENFFFSRKKNCVSQKQFFSKMAFHFAGTHFL